MSNLWGRVLTLLRGSPHRGPEVREHTSPQGSTTLPGVEVGAQNRDASTDVGRRRLLKGTVAAAPAVFTLYNGAARAAASGRDALVHEAAKYAEEQPLMCLPADEHDHWLRGEVTAYIVGDQEQGQITEVRYIAYSGYPGREGYWDNNGNCFTLASHTQVECTLAAPGDTVSVGDRLRILDEFGSFANSADRVDMNCLYCVDNDGNMSLINPETHLCDTGTPATASVWASMP